jgi:hypothetical protein
MYILDSTSVLTVGCGGAGGSLYVCERRRDASESYGTTFTAYVVTSHYGGVLVNQDGNQVGDESGTVGGGVIQELTSYTSPDPTEVYQPDMTYTLSLGVGLRNGSVPSAGYSLDPRLYYRTSDGTAANILADNLLVVGAPGGPIAGTLTNYSVTFTTPDGGPEIGQPIGIWIPSGVPVNNQTASGDFVFDSVGLTATPVPEPASLSLLALGATALLRRRRR